MKICKKIVLFTLTLVIIIGSFSFLSLNVFADNTYEILSINAGCAYSYSGYKTFSFSVPAESKITIKFFRHYANTNSSVKETFGSYYLLISDSNANLEYQKSGKVIYGNDEFIYVTLKKGDYELKFKSNTYLGEFKYVFCITGVPTADVKVKLAFDKNKIDLEKGQEKNLKLKVSPSYLSGNIKWSNSNKNVVSVNKDGQVTAKNLGTAKITVKKDEISTSCDVTVNRVATKTITKKESTSFLGLIKYINNNEKATWSSSNKKVATVNNKGTVTAKNAGKCNITCKIESQEYTMPLCVCTDYKYEILPEKIGSIAEGKTKTFSFNVPVESKVTIKFTGRLGDNADNSSRIYGTYGTYYLEILDSNKNAVFQKSGKNSYDDENISANLKKGNYKLKIKENNKYKFDYAFRIIGAPITDIKEQAKLNKSSINLTKGDNKTLKVTISPSFLSGAVKWSTSNKNVATVDDKGQVTGKNLGKAKIVVKKDNMSATCDVTVNKAEEQIVVKKGSASLSELIKHIKNNKKAKWSSSDKKIATVNSKGKVTAKNIGNCNIICSVGKQKYLIPLYVCADYTYKILPETDYEIDSGEAKKTISFNVPVESKVTVELYGSHSPCTASLKIFDSNKDLKLQMETDDFNFDEKSSVKLKKGNYKLTVESSPNYYSFDYYLSISGAPTVDVKVKSIKLNKNKISLVEGQNAVLKANISPKYLSKNPKWSTDNENVATVDKKGKVEAINLGTAKITVKKDKKSASCNVTVNKIDTQKVISKKNTSFSKFVKYIKGYKKAKWSSSNTKIATVNSKGTVTGKKNGKCNIICKIGKQKYIIPVKVVTLVTAKPSYVEEVGIYNDAWIQFTNNSDKRITYITLNITQYDNRGAKLRSPYDEYYVNETIGPDEKSSFEFWVNDDTKKIKVKIKKVWFSDGSTWKP